MAVHCAKMPVKSGAHTRGPGQFVHPDGLIIALADQVDRAADLRQLAAGHSVA